ncbi:hypothetical protein HN747_00525 [archaeon]|nr:hypothetical protein [archaeon]
MKKNEIKGIIHDLLDLRVWKHPLVNIFLNQKAKVNLLTGEVFGLDKDSLWELYKEKAAWFKERVGEAITDFENAEILIGGAREIVKIKFRGEDFEDSRIYGN